jgi:antitoxin HicB
MDYAYPVRYFPGDGCVQVRFPDVPEALTEGTDRDDARVQALDCLVAALGSYVRRRLPLPVPSAPKRGQSLVALPPLIAAKCALYQAMRTRRLTVAGFAERLGAAETTVRRLIDLDHRSHIGEVEAALAQLGKRLVVRDLDAA